MFLDVRREIAQVFARISFLSMAARKVSGEELKQRCSNGERYNEIHEFGQLILIFLVSLRMQPTNSPLGYMIYMLPYELYVRMRIRISIVYDFPLIHTTQILLTDGQNEEECISEENGHVDRNLNSFFIQWVVGAQKPTKNICQSFSTYFA